MTADIPGTMGEEAMLRHRLDRILKATKSAADLPPPSWWVGDIAAGRQVQDDISAGRNSWREAHRCSRAGLEALDSGDIEKAQTYLWMATDHFIAAILTRMRPSDLAVLQKPAAKRGRPAKK